MDGAQGRCAHPGDNPKGASALLLWVFPQIIAGRNRIGSGTLAEVSHDTR
jgi:hypothetical protein